MKRSLAAFGLALALAALNGAVASAQSAPTFEPGLWAIERTRSGGPGGAGTTVDQVCVTAAQLNTDPAHLLRPPPPRGNGQSGPSCTPSDLRMSAGKVSYLATCQGPMGTLQLPWQGVYGGTSFDISAQANLGLMSLSMRQVGRRVGACDSKN